MIRVKNKKTHVFMLVLLLILGIGFAALAATLKINGTITIDSAKWDVHFENVEVAQGSVTATTVPTSDDATTTEMTYAVDFTKPGDFYEFTVDMANDGTIDAMVNLVTNKVYAADGETEKQLPAYLSSTVTYDDGVEIKPNQLLSKQTSEKIKVRVEFRSDVDASDLPSTNETTIFKFSGTFKQADDDANNRIITFSTGKTKNNLEVGDEVCISDQCFNFIKYDGNDIVMLAKYNLNVGNNSYGEETFLQDSHARAYVSNESPDNYGNVPFSAINYWDDSGILKSEYSGTYNGPDYPVVYNPNYATAPDLTNCSHGLYINSSCYSSVEEYSIAYYVEQYKTKLINDYNIAIKNARLLTYDEAIDSSIGCEVNNYTCPTTGTNSFITNTSYWLGSAYDSYYIWYINAAGQNNGTIGKFGWNFYSYGVRPVIVISKSNM